MQGTQKIPIRLAGMLLLGYRRITLSEIRALPFVESSEESLFIAQRFLDAFEKDGYIIEVDTDGCTPEATLRLIGRWAKSKSRVPA